MKSPEKSPAPLDLASLFHPAVSRFFSGEFPSGPTEAQRLAWPRLARGESLLLVSPTGTGKTLAAFLVSLDRIVRRRLAGEKDHRLSTLYISPLKALDNDIHRNLDRPRDGIRRALTADFAEGGGPRPEGSAWEGLLTAEVRTGDTSPAARAAQLRRPPDILITTPESLYLMLTSAARQVLATVETVILDEIHSVAGNKRGVHLAVSMERLEDLIASRGGRSPQRIALSATVSPVKTVAAFAAGTGREMAAVVATARKRLDLTVTSPAPDFRDLPDSSAWGPAVATMVHEIRQRQTTLVFCNNRRLAERVSRKLGEALEIDVPTHHGSIAREVREGIETSLKAGSLPVLVATGSLELGIDIGHVDSVIQVESPKGIARGLQRVGRSGHLVGEEARGLFVPLYQDDLFESAATVEAMREGAVESTVPPEFPLDVLAQQLVAEAVSRASDGNPAGSEELYRLVRRAFPYRNLTRTLFSETLAMLSGKYPRERFSELAPKLVWDRATDRVTPLPGARLSAVVDGGTIGDRGTFSAVLPDRRTTVGELDEEFVYETRTGDVFLLGSRAWRAIEITHSRVVVEDATGQPARMPFWRGEGLGRTGALGERIGRLKRFIAGHLDDPELAADLLRRCGATPDAAAALAGAVRREVLDSGGLSCDTAVVFETFPNDIGDPCITVRSLFGRGVNLPWSLVLSSILRDETGVEVETVASDDGILLRLPGADRELPVARLSRISPQEARERLVAILPNSPMFGARFRENAQRALLLPRRRGGRRTPFWLQRLKARDLLETTRSFPDFPIVAETYRDCWRDIWEVERLLDLLGKIENGAVTAPLVARKTPSPASASLLFKFIAVYMYEWDAPKAEKSLHALAANRALLGEILGQDFDDGLRPEAVDAARREITRLADHRRARTRDELLLVFQEMGDLTAEEAVERSTGNGRAWLEDLLGTGSLTKVPIGGETRLVVTEEAASWRVWSPEIAEERIQRFLSTRGPLPASGIASRYGLAEPRVLEILERLRLEGRAVAGRFGTSGGERLWASSRVAEIIRRKSLALLRNEIRPVPVSVYRGFLCERQGAAPGHRFTGPAASEHAVAILRGLFLPLSSWETALLPARLSDPEPGALDLLSARGLLVWRASAVKDMKAARLQLFFRGEGH
ncbi:MAG: DEAD/DEAH box helicase, partial [Thermoanaerobaculia bacterium]|nr:DEAD/DEAH box helicase [Thermoanaerobaculia bacterium]